MRFRESANPKLLNSPGLLEMGFVACSVSHYLSFWRKGWILIVMLAIAILAFVYWIFIKCAQMCKKAFYRYIMSIKTQVNIKEILLLICI